MSSVPFNSRRNVYTAAAANGIGFAGFTLVMPFLPLYIRELGVTDVADIALWTGLTLGATPAVTAFSAPLWGMQTELLSKTSALIAGCDCDSGCPMCVGPIGETGPLAKTVALRILEHLLAGTQALPERAEEVPF